MLPFTIEEFFAVFGRYNQAVWPAQIALLVLGLAGIALTVRRRQGDLRWVCVILAILWLWTAFAYHIAFFRPVNPAAWLFGAAFAIQGLLLARYAWRADGAGAGGERSRWSTTVGVLLVAYALVGYPLVGWVVGHHYPASPTFGVPCPTTIYTLGILVWWMPAVRWGLLVIPVAWAVVGASAAVQLGVPEDWGLPAAAALAVAATVFGHRRGPAGFAVPRSTA